MSQIDDCEKCAALMEMRKQEGVRVRKIARQLLTTHQTGSLQTELNLIADELQCGHPLGDCGCEGTCFTRGDEYEE